VDPLPSTKPNKACPELSKALKHYETEVARAAKSKRLSISAIRTDNYIVLS